MTDIAPALSGAPSPAPAAAQSASARTGSSLISSDFETFLRMLTAQVENQDPLNPLESTEFATQLATFSGVEQQVKTNELLSGLAASGLSQISAWVGMEARAAAPVFFSGAPVEVTVAPAPSAVRAELVVRDEAETVVARQDVGTEGGPVQWTGRRADGTLLPPGTYAFEVATYDAAGGPAETLTPEAYGRVKEVRSGPDGPEVVFAGGATVPSNDVTAIRAP